MKRQRQVDTRDPETRIKGPQGGGKQTPTATPRGGDADQV